MSFAFALIRSAVFNSGWVQNISVSAIIVYSLVGAAKLNGIDPESYLRNVLSRIPEHPIHRISCSRGSFDLHEYARFPFHEPALYGIEALPDG